MQSIGKWIVNMPVLLVLGLAACQPSTATVTAISPSVTPVESLTTATVTSTVPTAQPSQTPWLVYQEPQPAPTVSSDDVLGHLVWGGGGAGAQNRQACGWYTTAGAVEGYGAAGFGGEPLASDSTVAIRSIYDAYQISTYSSGTGYQAFPAICSTDAGITQGASAISPEGVRYPALTAGPLEIDTASELLGVYGVWLPLEAFARPGSWTLVLDETRYDFSLIVEVPPTDRPIGIGDGQRLLITGFKPNERIKLVELIETATLETELRSESEVTADANGNTLTAWMNTAFLVGDQGTVGGIFASAENPTGAFFQDPETFDYIWIDQNYLDGLVQYFWFNGPVPPTPTAAPGP